MADYPDIEDIPCPTCGETDLADLEDHDLDLFNSTGMELICTDCRGLFDFADLRESAKEKQADRMLY